MNSPRILIQTFGCQMNQLDSEMISAEFVQAGYKLIDNQTEADIILLNACSVREHAEERVYSLLANLKQVKLQRPDLIIGLIGCMAQKEKINAIHRIPYLNLVVGPHQHKKLPYYISQILSSPKVIISTSEYTTDGLSYHRLNQPYRRHAYILAMKGCDNFCSYCVVPYLRGRVVSRPIKDIVAEAISLTHQGCQDITLLGQNIAAYGMDQNSGNLVQLLACLHDIKGIKTICFLTSHPAYVSSSLLEAMRDLPKVKKFLHMPAQSGSNQILARMNRRYTREQYLDIIRMARILMPEIKFSSDFIVGFPGETEADFQDTINLVKEVGFAKGYVFKYSVRPGTEAAKLTDDVPLSVKKQRHRILLSLFKH